ncbi:MAG: hypothetical protein APF81_23780 [Desulfosporosinus sp. BRH_c37]|nr:MAG: hypothetical protein APF81_23780 [Desulfosporosinus sp. BRH_c37]
MNSTFFGIELSRRALESQQAALNVTGHNISNSNTQGYTRQIPNLTSTTPQSILGSSGRNLSLGTGVTLDTITRARDMFVDRQFRWENSKQQYWEGRQDSLGKIEGLLNEPSDDSISNDMTKFWTAWSNLSKDPDNLGARSVVREQALTLTDSFHNIAQQVSNLRQNMNETIKTQVKEINTYAQQIKDLNDQIKRAEISGDNPNDLRDQRDMLVDDLSKVVCVRVIESKDTKFTDRNVSNYKIVIGNENAENNTLVDNGTYRLLEDPPPQNDEGFSNIVWSDDTSTNVDLGVKFGTLSANLEIRDQDLTKFSAQLDSLAQGIASAVNALHQTGQGLTIEDTGGINFFTDGSDSPTLDSQGLPVVTAETINLNSVIESDINRIASGAQDSTMVTVGDGSVAIGISSLAVGWDALKDLMAAGKLGATDQNAFSAASLGDYYSANVAQLGVDVQQANRMKAGEDVLVTNLTNQRESSNGVSLDEEMTNLVKFQKSYTAAARMVTMMDDMLETIVKGMGITR